MKQILIAISSILLVTAASAREWPSTFTRNVYNRYYVENRTVQSMPIDIESLHIVRGKPAHLSFITGYTTFKIGQSTPQQYVPPYACYIKSNVPYYDRWTFMLAVDNNNLTDCRYSEGN